MGTTTKEIGGSSFNDMISSVDRRSEYVENRAGANVRLNNFLTPYTLDDKSSILNAPCGYSNGVYASLRPSDAFGPELLTNGDFSQGTNSWTAQLNANFSVNNGVATIQSAQVNSLIFQFISPSSVSAILKIEIDVVSFTGSQFFIYFHIIYLRVK